ncbi:MAG: hypothetical protein HY787_01155 [Deltaproteobacteria bacterium]|nr:hypothetical protein [Deltaproteobacteria bacterium]
MIIAIPLFDRRVAPRFDCARRFLLAEIEGPESRKRQWVTIEAGPVQKRIQQLKDLKVETVICGGIDTESARLLHLSNIPIIDWVAGEAEDAVQCFLRRELESGTMVDRGGHCCGRWAFRERVPGFGGWIPVNAGEGHGQGGPIAAGRQGRRGGRRGKGR